MHTTTEHRWTDDFLDGMRAHGDALAEEALRRMLTDGEEARVDVLFRGMTTNDARPPHDGFPAFEDFYAQTHRLPDFVDRERIARAEDLFLENVFPIVLVLLSKSLTEGYAAPNLSRILNLSGNLRRHPYHRLLSVLQMVLNVAASRGFTDGGAAVITAQKVRLLHAGIRHICDRHIPDYRERYGVPVNLEDMLATIMGFSYLVITGLRRLHGDLSREQEEDLFYLWRIYALLCGIHPPGEAESLAWIPTDVEDAGAFYAAYARRHYVDAADNADGVALAGANLSMLQDMIPSGLKLVGFGLAPRIYMQHLSGPVACRRVGVAPVPGHTLLKAGFDAIPVLLLRLQRLFRGARQHAHLPDHHVFSRWLFQGLIDLSLGHPVTFTVPVTMKDFHKMV